MMICQAPVPLQLLLKMLSQSGKSPGTFDEHSVNEEKVSISITCSAAAARYLPQSERPCNV